MDDDDDQFMEDDDDFGFEYEENSDSEPDADLENQYYSAKTLKELNQREAIGEFAKVLELESEKGEWGFKALKQMIKLLFHLSEFDQMMVRYHQLLTYINNAVTRNHSEKAINSILDYISTSQNMELLQNFYETTLTALQEAKMTDSGSKLILSWANFTLTAKSSKSSLGY